LDAANPRSYPQPYNGTDWQNLVVVSSSISGSLVNGVVYTGSNGGALTFDGTNDYTLLPNSPNLTPGTGEFTSDFWINPTLWTNNNYQPVQVTAITNGLWIGQNASNQFIVRAYGVADRLQYSVLPSTGSWTNVTITRISNNTISLYYNSNLVAISSSSQNFVQGSTYIGSDGPVSSGAVFFNGKISSVKYYNRALSASEVLQNFNATRARFGV